MERSYKTDGEIINPYDFHLMVMEITGVATLQKRGKLWDGDVITTGLVAWSWIMILFSSLVGTIVGFGIYLLFVYCTEFMVNFVGWLAVVAVISSLYYRLSLNVEKLVTVKDKLKEIAAAVEEESKDES